MKVILPAFIVVLTSISSFSQIDSLVFKNGNYIVGEIKSMDRGVIVVKTDYSSGDFKIEWDEIRRIYTDTYFLISFTDGMTKYGTLESSSDSTIIIISDNDQMTGHEFDHIEMLVVPFEKVFKDRFRASIDLGASLTKAKNLRQLNSRSMVGYKAENWSSEAVFNILRSTQSEADTILRREAGIVFRYLIYRKWYVSGTISILSNTEQKLDLRNNSKIGLGKYFIQTNRSLWGIRLGINRNLERFTNETPDRNSWEVLLGTDLDLFDIGDFSLLSKLNAYRSITEPGRWRLDGVFDAKYSLPLDFYIKASISLNYDNQPAQEASDTDYIFHTGIGWEW